MLDGECRPESAMTLQTVAQQTLFLFGLGFLGANLKVGADFFRYWRKRRGALLVWRRPRPRHYGFSLLLGLVQALLLAGFVLFKWPGSQIFGLAMMLVYFLGAMPLSTRIDRGFYRDGVWADTGFVPWGRISGVSWREEPVTLVLTSQVRTFARRLQVPGNLYGQARKVLRDRIREHDIHIEQGLGLADERDDRDAV
jgi:hypothetical protein